MERKLYKLIEEVENAQLFSHQQHIKISNYFNEKNINEKYYFVYDDYTDVPYKDDYLFGKKSSEEAGHIWLMGKENNLIDLGEASDIVKALRNNAKIKHRAYCDRTIYSDFIGRFYKGGM